ncbi:hypothetical protein ACOMHN_015131 [Nucella lapillus]
MKLNHQTSVRPRWSSNTHLSGPVQSPSPRMPLRVPFPPTGGGGGNTSARNSKPSWTLQEYRGPPHGPHPGLTPSQLDSTRRQRTTTRTTSRPDAFTAGLYKKTEDHHTDHIQA